MPLDELSPGCAQRKGWAPRAALALEGRLTRFNCHKLSILPHPRQPSHTDLHCTAQFLRSCSLQSLSHPPIRCPVLPLILCKRMASPLDHLTLALREERREKKERQERRAESGERRERSKGTESWEMREGGGFSTLVSKLRFRNVVSEILFQSFRSRTLISEL